MTRLTLLGATVLTALATAAGPAAAQPISGLYVGANTGVNFLQQVNARNFSYPNGALQNAFGHVNSQVGVAVVANLGYGLGNGLRFELEGNYRNNRISPSGAPGVISNGGREQKYGAMANVLFDLDIGSPWVFPYIGAGVGAQAANRRTSLTANAVFNTPVGTYSGTNANMLTSGTETSFAYQAIAGLSFPIPWVVGLSGTAEYRYMSLVGDRTYQQTITGTTPGGFTRSIKVTGNDNHSLLIGVRYAFNVAPPPVEAPPPPPVATAARSYLVFFDWDRADLTDRARQIVAEAAAASTKVAVTRIEVAGHTDTTGTPQYNQGLSVRRAQTVARELIRLGVPAASIHAQGFGQTQLLVPTGPGVREAQNRRVEIVLR